MGIRLLAIGMTTLILGLQMPGVQMGFAWSIVAAAILTVCVVIQIITLLAPRSLVDACRDRDPHSSE